MATVISKEELDAHRTAMLDRAWAGEEIVVEQSGAPKLRLVPVDHGPTPKGKRRMGTLAGRIKEAPGVWDPLTDEELKDWGL